MIDEIFYTIDTIHSTIVHHLPHFDKQQSSHCFYDSNYVVVKPPHNMLFQYFSYVFVECRMFHK